MTVGTRASPAALDAAGVASPANDFESAVMTCPANAVNVHLSPKVLPRPVSQCTETPSRRYVGVEPTALSSIHATPAPPLAESLAKARHRNVPASAMISISNTESAAPRNVPSAYISASSSAVVAACAATATGDRLVDQNVYASKRQRSPAALPASVAKRTYAPCARCTL